MRVRGALLAVTMVFVWLSSSVHAFQFQYYKWMDEQGTVHYSQSPPPGRAQEDTPSPQPATADVEQATRPTASPQTPMESKLSAHLRVIYAFLTAWGNENWAEARRVAAEQVWVRIGEKILLLDLPSGQAEVTLVLPFQGISTVRVEGEVKGVTVDEIGLKVGKVEKRGPGTVTLEEKGGKYRVKQYRCRNGRLAVRAVGAVPWGLSRRCLPPSDLQVSLAG